VGGWLLSSTSVPFKILVIALGLFVLVIYSACKKILVIASVHYQVDRFTD